MTTATALLMTKTVPALIGYGACLGIGFWVSKKLTNKIDETLLLYDRKRLQKLSEEMELDHV